MSDEPISATTVHLLRKYLGSMLRRADRLVEAEALGNTILPPEPSEPWHITIPESLQAPLPETVAPVRKRTSTSTRGRKRLEESPSSQGRAYAEQARDLLASGEVRTIREAAERLMVDYDSLGDDSIAVSKAIRAAEVRLGRYLRQFRDPSE